MSCDRVSGKSQDVEVTVARIKRTGDIITALIRWGVILVGVILGAFRVDNIVDLQPNPIGQLQAFVTFVGMLVILPIAVGALVWAWWERRLRQEKTEWFQQRIAQLEKQLDPNRTSSGLAPTGETAPEDL